MTLPTWNTSVVAIPAAAEAPSQRCDWCEGVTWDRERFGQPHDGLTVNGLPCLGRFGLRLDTMPAAWV